MNTDKDEKYISDLIDWNTDIEPYPITAMFAPCGSGKNQWIENIVSGLQPGPNGRIAIITSRNSKRIETLANNNNFSGYVDLDGNVFMDRFSYILYTKYNIVTEQYSNYYNIDNNKVIKDACIIPAQVDNVLIDACFADQDNLNELIDVFWDDFDLLVIDEVHSLLLDSSYMISQARIAELIKAFVRKCPNNKHMILMTATPDGIKPLLKSWIKNLHVLDFSKEAFGIIPAAIRITPKEQVKREQELLYQNGIKFIYNYNGKALFLSEYCNETILKEEDGISLFSKFEMREALKRANYKEYKRMIEVEKYLAENKEFPPEIKFVLTTSRNREGNSYLNEDFKYMFVDSHIPSEVIQYSGRLRKAEFVLTIVDGSPQYGCDTIEKLREIQKQDKDYIPLLNEQFNNIDDDKYRKLLISNVESKYSIINNKKVDNPEYRPYIFFNPFSFHFEFNELKSVGEIYIAKALKTWANLDRTSLTSFSSYIRKWFQKPVNIQNYETDEIFSIKIFNKEGFRINNKTTKRYYTEDKINRLKYLLIPIWGEFSRINTYLNRFMPDLQFIKIKDGPHKDCFELVKKSKSSIKS